MPEYVALPHDLVAIVYTRGDRELAELPPETRARLNHLSEAEAEYLHRSERGDL